MMGGPGLLLNQSSVVNLEHVEGGRVIDDHRDEQGLSVASLGEAGHTLDGSNNTRTMGGD